jgi:hypothetical protein
MTNNFNTISRQLQKCGNMKYRTQNEIQVFTDDHADTINTTPIHVCLKRLISNVSTRIGNFLV